MKDTNERQLISQIEAQLSDIHGCFMEARDKAQDGMTLIAELRQHIRQTEIKRLEAELAKKSTSHD